MRLTIGIDPGKSGGYAIAWGGQHKIALHTLDEDFEFVEHMQDLKDHPDVTSIEAVVEHVPPFVGKAIPSSTSFKLGKSCGFLEGVLRALEIPFVLTSELRINFIFCCNFACMNLLLHKVIVLVLLQLLLI